MSTGQFTFEDWKIEDDKRKIKERRLTYGQFVRRLLCGKNKIGGLREKPNGTPYPRRELLGDSRDEYRGRRNLRIFAREIQESSQNTY